MTGATHANVEGTLGTRFVTDLMCCVNVKITPGIIFSSGVINKICSRPGILPKLTGQPFMICFLSRNLKIVDNFPCFLLPLGSFLFRYFTDKSVYKVLLHSRGLSEWLQYKKTCETLSSLNLYLEKKPMIEDKYVCKGKVFSVIQKERIHRGKNWMEETETKGLRRKELKKVLDWTTGKRVWWENCQLFLF